jgi:plasmid stabilization system protein ParE
LKSRVSTDALVETRAIRRWYRERNKGTAVDFQREYVQARRLIEMWPDAGADLGDGVRRVLLHSFPYGVIYEVRDRVVVIIAVAHTSRDPRYWLGRL